MIAVFTKFICLIYGRWDLLGADVASLDFHAAAGGTVLLAVGIPLALGLAVLAYSRTTEAVTLKMRILLGLLRAATLLLIAIALMGTSTAIRYRQPVKPVVGVLVDDSRSMAIADAGGERSATRDAALEKLQSALAGTCDVRAMKTGDAPVTAKAKELFTAADTGAAQAFVLLTDGRESNMAATTGESIGAGGLDALAGIASAPVYAVSIGSDDPPRDVAVLRASPREFVYEKDDALVRATIKVSGFGKAKIGVAIEDEAGKAVASKEVDAEDGVTDVLLTFRPQDAGLRRYTLRVADVPGEATADNNRCEFHLDVRRDKIKVLLIDGAPNFEYRHVKEAFESDPAIVPSALIRLPDSEWLLQGRQEREDGQPVISKVQGGFPATEKELFDFDVLILGDLERKFYEAGSGERFEMIRRFLTQRGGGLMTIGGFSVYGAGDFESTPLAEILPVMVKTEKKRQIRNRYGVKISDAALTHPAMQLEYDPAQNAKVWEQLPMVEGGSAIYGPKAGATVLAYHPYLKNQFGPRVLMAAGQYGRGRVLASALDTTYRWRIAREAETDYFRRFWSLAVRWLAGSPQSKGVKRSLYLDRPVLEAGGCVRLMTNVRDKDFNPVADAAVTFTVKRPDGGESEHLSASARQIPGMYWHEVSLQQPGEYVFAMEVKEASGDAVKDQLACRVQPSRQELANVAADHRSLRLLCEGSGGKLVQDAGEIASLLTVKPSLRPGIAVIELWRAIPTMIVVVLLLGAEWLLRKRRGLA
ncbi:MAG TPA: glutamine amidotransferase [Planctomycetota bacterium]|nr:glutamine amidotransferase [Planctomycetota bacterium]